MSYLVLSWNYADKLCRRIAFDIFEDGFCPDSVVALARGGVFAGNLLCDYLDVDEFFCLDIDKGDRIAGKRVLVVDDFINTGRTMRRALELVEAEEVKTASLLMLERSEFIPDYLGDYMTDYAWIIFPWNFVDDISRLILEILEMEVEVSQPKLKRLLSERGLNPFSLETAIPGRFEEVLRVLELRGLVERRVEEGRIYWRILK
ncbi:phosphoribosyltransferase [Archaeoglobus neptunius]|uniref:phosphoribosyltransferase n=1 Tax=Archaeoglobus neptunius TaxID=2798580 RepID=UPI0019272D8F|nr:phosphoribosyltransferase [Archaeoglobus neptunius]